MTTLGRHLIAEFYDCDRAFANDVDRIRQLMLAATKEVKASVMGEVFRAYGPQGVSGTVVIAESHLSIHTWPEHGYVAVDIFTCGGLDPRPGFELLGRELGALSCRVHEIVRGLPADLAAARALLPEDVSVVSELAAPRQLRDFVKRILQKPNTDGIDPGLASSPDHNVFGLHFRERESSVVLVPVPWDATTSYRKGTADGPQAIQRASAQLDLYDRELGKLGLAEPWRWGIHLTSAHRDLASWNETASGLAAPIIELGGEIADEPDLKRDLDQIDRLSDAVNRAVAGEVGKRLDQGKIVGVVGGDHSVSFGAIAAHAERFPDLGILHIDAHADLRKAFEGFAHSHASIFRNVLDSIPTVKRLVQVGIRDVSSEEVALIERDPRVVTLFDGEASERRFNGESWRSIVDSVVAQLPANVYVSFDIDGLDPALCPNTGTPVPGGLSFAEAQFLLLSLARANKRVVGFDLCEVAPPTSGDDEWDGNVAARILYRMCGVALVTNEAQNG